MPMLTIRDSQVYENVRELANRKGITMTAVVARGSGSSAKLTFGDCFSYAASPRPERTAAVQGHGLQRYRRHRGMSIRRPTAPPS
ncbi:hypothetical protein [Mobiluncus curtisii]|uniref:hypothetical protein n=1 Tax=Mobiluncus curtisii TaxID=2051 RepID=UPI002433016A|nr:hypothetical protein [Mobiluncus curtisii]